MPPDIAQKIGVLRLDRGQNVIGPGQYAHYRIFEALLMLLKRAQLVQNNEAALRNALKNGRCDAAHVFRPAVEFIAAYLHYHLRILDAPGR